MLPPSATAVASEIASGRLPAADVRPRASTLVIELTGPDAVPPPNRYALGPRAAAPTSCTATGSAPTRAGAPGAARTTSLTEASAAFRPPARIVAPPAVAIPGSCTGAGRRREETSWSARGRAGTAGAALFVLVAVRACGRGALPQLAQPTAARAVAIPAAARLLKPRRLRARNAAQPLRARPLKRGVSGEPALPSAGRPKFASSVRRSA